LASLDLVDRTISKKIHEALIRPQFLELIVFPFAFAFSPYFVPILIFMSGFILPRQDIFHLNGKVYEYDEELEKVPRHYKTNPYFYILQYTAQIIIVLILTTILKKATKRVRPVVPDGSKRMVDLRSKENNGSMPSGDTS
jgi:hypothetical protein